MRPFRGRNAASQLSLSVIIVVMYRCCVKIARTNKLQDKLPSCYSAYSQPDVKVATIFTCISRAPAVQAVADEPLEAYSRGGEAEANRGRAVQQ